ncbi:MAG: glycosyltransferase N-terminal domain-containing protein [Bacteroidota bacterium]
MVWWIIYDFLVIPLGWVAFQIFRLIDPKVRRGIRGRKDLFCNLQTNVGRLPGNTRRIWFHSSSMGEFEQAKPIIAELKKRNPSVEIVVSFFSPSGYEHAGAYKPADIITYLPFDSSRNAERFVSLVRPSAAVMVRYDLWPNHLRALQRAKIPIFIANATLRQNSARSLPLAKQFHRAVYNSLDYILTVSESDKRMFESFDLNHPLVDVMGDTRYDQVWQRSADSKTHHYLPASVIDGKKLLVVGSSWQEDEDELFPAVRKLVAVYPDLLVILVPHEPNMETLERIEYRLNAQISSIRFSMLSDYNNERLIIIDSVGILMALYQYAHVAYVGGSFRQGVHNVLEPAAYGIPLVIGPKHENSQEALKLIASGAAFVGTNAEELYRQFRMLIENDEPRRRAGQDALEFVRRNVGATKRFLSYLERVL